MSNQIGNISIGSIINANVGKTVNMDEFDVLDREVNSVIIGEQEAERIQIDFVVTKNDVIDGVSLEDQKERISRLVNRDSYFNSFSYVDLILGFISVTDVNFKEDSERKNILEGSLNGIFLPWPKFFSQLSEPSSDINNYGAGFYGSGIYHGYPTYVYNKGVYGDGKYGK